MKRILIVDDVEGWRNYHSAVLNKLSDEELIIEYADSASSGYNLILQNSNSPYDIILTDLQMENDYSPKYAGEWLVEEIKKLNKYYNSKIVIISATYNIKNIADSLNVFYIRKSDAKYDINNYQFIIE